MNDSINDRSEEDFDLFKTPQVLSMQLEEEIPEGPITAKPGDTI